MGVIKHYKKRETILLEDTKGDRFFRILSGEVLICKSTKRKGLVTIAKLGTGEIFGEMYLLDKNGYRSASAIAATDVVVEMYPQQDLVDALEASPPDSLELLGTLAKRLRNTTQSYTFSKAVMLKPVGSKAQFDRGSSMAPDFSENIEE